jgi:hypothetical protein
MPWRVPLPSPEIDDCRRRSACGAWLLCPAILGVGEHLGVGERRYSRIIDVVKAPVPMELNRQTHHLDLRGSGNQFRGRSE